MTPTSVNNYATKVKARTFTTNVDQFSSFELVFYSPEIKCFNTMENDK